MRALWLVLAALFACGALGDPFLPHEVPFESVEREHFDALGVVRETAPSAPASGPLTLRVHVVGDAADSDIDEAAAWLAEHAGIRLVRDPDGAPLFLTLGDLAATSGRGTLGATVPEGMAAEVQDPRVGPCVVAHEVLHFVGLKHVKDKRNIMYAHCSKDFLERASFEGWQREAVDKVTAIRATTPGGVELWASR
ncbi:MAG TPA: hypothetical protein VM370_00565 [Candidatus Thermoplasmatota archaeon]|nr:hypothetical protein [Candidatus Thermoplasmatota archaeon]